MPAEVFKRSGTRAKGKTLWAGFLRASGVLGLAKAWVRRRGTIVLTFHRVLPDADLERTASLTGMVVRERTFAEFLKHAAEKYSFVDLTQEPDWRPGQRLRLAVTFDDGWSDNASFAYPIARENMTPLTIFIVPERMGAELPFWPERAVAALRECPPLKGDKGRDYIDHAIESLKCLPADERDQRVDRMEMEHNARRSSSQVDRTMRWEQISELREGGVTFGSHTCTHEILTTVPLERAEHEINDSRGLIEQRLGSPCALFSYPNGDFTRCVRSLVHQAGYRLAFTNQTPGVWTRKTDPYLIPRVNVCEYHLVDSEGQFSALMFDYAVIWHAAKGLAAESFSSRLKKFRTRVRGWFTRVPNSGKNHFEESS